MKPARPPRFCAWAITVRVSVVFPELSGSEHLNHAPAWKTSHSKGAINQDISRGDNLDGRHRRIPKPANCFAAVVFLDLLNGQIEIFRAHRGRLFLDSRGCIFSLRHSLEELRGIAPDDKGVPNERPADGLA